MPSIDPIIVEHEIKDYNNARPVWQKMQLVNPKKVAAIKVEVEKLLKNKLIYLIPFT
jgi:hypothetical protein